MDFGFNFGYGRPDERAFTDHNLIELSRRHRREVRAGKFDQNREAETAADFEWWLGDGERYLPMRVQAKKLDLTIDAYNEITNKTSDGREKQIERLIKTSQSEGFLPLYLFYNGPPLSGSWPRDRCTNKKINKEMRGCTVALAEEVLPEIERGKSLEALGPISRPWQCLTCCPLSKKSNPGERAIEVLSDQDEVRAADFGVELTEDVPPYVRRLQTADSPTGLTLEPNEPHPGSRTVLLVTAPEESQDSRASDTD